jgi:hypothetical protein
MNVRAGQKARGDAAEGWGFMFRLAKGSISKKVGVSRDGRPGFFYIQ